MNKIGFDSDKYLSLQSEKILQRISGFGGKLYIEFGGKLFDDYHAARVLPGFAPDNKIKMLKKLKDVAEIVIVISSKDIEKNKMRADLGITYDQEVIRLIEVFRSYGLYVGSIVLTRFSEDDQQAKLFQKKLERKKIKVYHHYSIAGYPHNVQHIVSDDGFGKNEYIETKRDLVIVTAPGPGSGKMATCLSQLYQEHKRGHKVGYAKYETFPVWNLPLNHPVNVAYEAATADLSDMNMIDPWHLAAYGETAVNYNRDVEIFPVLTSIFDGIYGTCPYKSPTDMGVNMLGFCICNDDVCREASKQEIIRRYYTALHKMAMGAMNETEVSKIRLLMKQAGISTDDRITTVAAKKRAQESGNESSAIQLSDGTMITAGSSPLLGTCASLLLNSIKHLAGIDHELKLIPQDFIEPIQKTKVDYLGGKNPRLHMDEVLVALSVLSLNDANCRRALAMLPELNGLQAHSTVMLSQVDQKILKKLGISLTCDPASKK